MRIKVCKKENKFYRLSFAMLANVIGDRFAMGCKVELDGREGVVSGRDLNHVSVLWTDVNEAEQFTYAAAVNKLHVSQPAVPRQVKADQPVSRSAVPRTPAPTIAVNSGDERVDALVALAVAKQMIDVTDVEVTAMQLTAGGQESVERFAAEVNEFTADDIVEDAHSASGVTPQMNDAEKALAALRSGSGSSLSLPGIGDLGAGSGSRSLKDLSYDKVDVMNYSTAATELDVDSVAELLGGKSALTGDEVEPPVSNEGAYRRATAAVHDEKPMSNIRGLTKPIVTPSKQFTASLADQLSEALGDTQWGRTLR